MTKSFAPDSFHLLGMGDPDLGSHLVNMRTKSHMLRKAGQTCRRP